ncbi:MAG TPA: type II secretion system minor pseudopilin GspI [Halioglobus sp.]
MRARGFTLVEVMVALAIVAIALPAVLMALYQQVDDTAYLRDKSIAQMVAANKLAEMRLVIASTRNLSAGRDNGLATMADRDWHWWVETKATEAVPQFFRIEISVALENEEEDTEEQPEHPLFTLTAFMSGDFQVDEQGLEGAPGTPVPDSNEESVPEDSTNSTDNVTSEQSQDIQQDIQQDDSQVPADGS